MARRPVAGHARFARTDLRHATIARCVLDQTTFIDCRMADLVGVPELRGAVAIDRADISPSGNGSDLRDDAYFLRLWTAVID